MPTRQVAADDPHSAARLSIGDLWSTFKATGSGPAREQLIVHYSPLVKYVASRVATGLPSSVEQADLVQYGMFGLMDAINKFDLAREIKSPMELAVGLIDVKNSWIELPELVADRLRQVLQYIEPERVQVTPDCGFSQTARHIAKQHVRVDER